MIKRLHQKTLQLLIKYHIICIDFDSEQETEKFLDKTNKKEEAKWLPLFPTLTHDTLSHVQLLLMDHGVGSSDHLL